MFLLMNRILFETKRTARCFWSGVAPELADEIWWVLHGYGMDAEAFLGKFDSLIIPGRCIMAPEGLNRFYQKGFTGITGANWMTRAERDSEIADHLFYLNGLRNKTLESRPGASPKEILLGFSQGTAMISRWAWQMEGSSPEALILWGGEPAAELQPQLSDLGRRFRKALWMLGTQDPFISAKAMDELKERSLDPWDLILYEGGHDIEKLSLDLLQKQLN
jgi:predicted esterase